MQLSWRLQLLNKGLRLFVKPQLGKTSDPSDARKTLALIADLVFRKPPFLRHYLRDGEIHWFASGQCHPGKAVLYFHGGGYVAGSPYVYSGLLAWLSRLSRIEVCAPDYRLAPANPAPAAFDDCLAAWDHLMEQGFQPKDIVIGGDSAGGGLALAVLSVLCHRGTLPAGCFVMSPCVDFTMSGESLISNQESDVILPAEQFPDLAENVLQGLDPKDPRISPFYAEFSGAPNVLMHYSETEILKSDALRMAERLRSFGASVAVNAHPDAPHVWHLLDGWIPEARTSLREIACFVQDCFAETSR